MNEEAAHRAPASFVEGGEAGFGETVDERHDHAVHVRDAFVFLALLHVVEHRVAADDGDVSAGDGQDEIDRVRGGLVPREGEFPPIDEIDGKGQGDGLRALADEGTLYTSQGGHD